MNSILMKKPPFKGEYGYIEKKKKTTIVWTIFLFIIAVAIFLLGYFTTGKRENLFTVLAVLDLLPASRSAVNMIMYLRTPRYDKSIQENIESNAGDVKVLYQLYMTSYKKNFSLDCISVRGNNVIGLSTFDKCDINACQEHIEFYGKQNGFNNLTIKIFDNEKKFIDRLVQLNSLDTGNKEDDLVELMKDLSL